MEVTSLVWGLTIAAICGLLLFDFVFHVRKAHAPTLREAAIWSGLYVGLALLFGVGVLVLGDTQPPSFTGVEVSGRHAGA
jgi:tellurite resistance protein TerC